MDEMKNGVITLIDILGWKGIWTRKSDAISTLSKLIAWTKNGGKYIQEQELILGAPNLFKDLEVEIKSISDTIAIITYCDNPSIALEFHAVMNAVITSSSIKLNIPIRGATSYGKLSINDNIMVGPAVDEVASWYEMTEWIGVIQTPSAMFLTNTSEFIFKEAMLTKYPVKTKKIGIYETYCVNWVRTWNRKEGRNDLIKCFMDMGPITPEIAEKYINTLKFYDQMNDELSKE